MKKKVAVVSAFGRGHFVAQSLAEKGLDVTLYDLSGQFRTPAQEWAGPFPFLKSLSFDDRAENWFTAKQGSEPQPQGLVVVTHEGPLELRNQNVERALGLRGIDISIQQPIPFAPKNFKSGWLSQVETAGWSAIEHNPARLEKKSKSRILDLFCKSYSLNESFFEARNLEGVKVVHNAQIEDIVIGPKKRIEGLLVKQERSEMLPFDQVIWALGSQETNWVSPAASEKIFGGTERESAFTWVSFEATIADEKSQSRHWPLHFLWLEDPAFPWSREHFVTVKTLNSTHKQFWFRWPTHLLFSSPQLSEMIHVICKRFQKRFDCGTLQVTKFPLSISETANVTGPALFQVYREGLLQSSIEKKCVNLHFLNFEATASLAQQDLLILEMNLYHKISNWLDQELALEAKRQKNNRETTTGPT